MDIERWLGLGQYAAAFKANGIDGALLADLTAEDLESIGINSVGHRRKLLAAIARLPPASQPSPPKHSLVRNGEHRSQEAERRLPQRAHWRGRIDELEEAKALFNAAWSDARAQLCDEDLAEARRRLKDRSRP